MGPTRKYKRLIFYVLMFCFVLLLVFWINPLLSYQPKLPEASSISIQKRLSISRLLCYPLHDRSFLSNRLYPLNYSSSDNSSAYVTIKDALRQAPMLGNYSNLTEFIVQTREVLLSRRLKHSIPMIPTIFRSPPFNDIVKPSCDGLWIEFGVASGKSLLHVAKWKTQYCGNTSEPIYGFDTFSGLPTNWRPGFDRGRFSLPNGTLPVISSNVILVKGLFIDTLPSYLRRMDDQYKCHTPVAFVHIDCDIYDGARDILFLLGNRLVPGSIIIFDELFNYPAYEKHEIKAFYEFLAGSNLQLVSIGSSTEIKLDISSDIPLQSFGFVVVSNEENDN